MRCGPAPATPRCPARSSSMPMTRCAAGANPKGNTTMDVFASIQNGITTMLTTREPEFLRYGQNLFLSLATIVLAWQGITLMFSSDDPLSERLFGFAKTLLFVSVG